MGIFPHGARWYLASIAMLALLCIGIHLSIQIRAQQKAEQTIIQWGDENGVRIANVRYHLLRNALILQQVSLKRGNDVILIDHLLVRANPEMLTGTDPRISAVEIAGIDIAIDNPFSTRQWEHANSLERLWQAARNIALRNGSITLTGSDKEKPMVIEDITMQRKSTISDSLTAHGLINGVPVQLLYKKRPNMAAITTFSWHEVDAAATARTFGLDAIDGTLSGWAQWHEGMDGVPPLLQGEISLHDESEQIGRLRWQGKGRPESLSIDLQSEQWPISIWRNQLPVIDRLVLSQGQLNGEIHAVKSAQGWQLNAQRLDLHEVAFTNPEMPDFTWSWQDISLHETVMDVEQRQINMSILYMKNGHMRFQPLATSSHHSDDAPWQIQISKGELNNTELQFELPKGMLRIPTLNGQFQLNQNQQLGFEMASSPRESDSAPPWSLNGHIEKTLMPENSTTMRVRGNHIALAQLRPLLPLHGSDASALTLEGEASFDISLNFDARNWQLQGKANAYDLSMTHAGDSWSAEQLSTQFGPLGSDFTTWQVHEILADDWHYITALQPIPPYQHNDRATSETEAKRYWWAENLLEENWEIGTLEWKNGSISLGNADALWGDKLDLKITPIARDKKSALTMYGNIGEGELIAAGYWQPLNATAPFLGNVTLQNALPFFLNEWFIASGIPRFTRGRFNAALEISPGEHADDYISQVELILRQAQCDQDESPQDQLLARTGLNTTALISKLDDGEGNIGLQWSNFGNWPDKPLSLARLGHGMQQQLKSALIAKTGMTEPNTTSDSATPEIATAPKSSSDYHEETRIRLHQRASITLNESIRMHKVVRKLLTHPELMIELVPIWPGHKLDQETEARIAFTQRLIGRFLNNRRVGYERIFPILPSASDHTSELGAIIMRTRPR